MNDPILLEEGTVSWDIVLSSPNAVSYRLWVRQPEKDWEIVKDGGLSDDVVDQGSHFATKGTEFAYWFGIGSTKPNSPYKLAVVLRQNGNVLVNGVLPEMGNVDNSGLAIKQKSISYKL